MRHAYAVGSDPLYSSPYWAATHFEGDLLFTCPALRAARSLSSGAEYVYIDIDIDL